MPGPTSTDTNFERTFADLAYARLRDKAPSLLDHLIGFQLIDKNDDETRAVGVFGFKVGPEWVYAPVFFINGELKGHELMYMKSQDAFVPMTEEWVNYLLNRRPQVLGEGEDTPRNELPIRQPDFDVFSRAPGMGSKYASARRTYNDIATRVRPDFRAFMPVFTVSPSGEKYAALDVPGFLKRAGAKAAYALVNTMRHDEKFADAVLSFYDLKDLLRFEKTAGKVSKAEAGYQEDAAFNKCGECDNYSPPRSCEKVEGDISSGGTSRLFAPETVKPIEPMDNPLAPKSAADTRTVEMDEVPYRDKPKGQVVVLTRTNDLSYFDPDLTEADRKRLLKDQYIVKDERNPDKRSRLYKSQLSATIQGPTETGIYDVMTGSGEARRMWVIVDPIRVGWSPSNLRGISLVVDAENKRYGNYHPSDVLTIRQDGSLSNETPDLSSPNELGYDDEAMLIGPRGSATGIFRVDNSISHPDGTTELDVCGLNSFAPSSTHPRREGMMYANPSFSNDDLRTILLTDKDGKLTRIGETLFVPKSYKAFILQKGKPRSGNYPIGSSRSSGELNLGTLNDVIYKLSKTAEAKKQGIYRMQMRTDGIGFTAWVDGHPGKSRTKLASLKHLIEDHGLGQEDAETLIKEARPRHSVPYFIKYAQAPMQGYFPEPQMASEYGINAPVQYPMTDTQNLGNIDSQGNRDYYRNDRYIDQGARQYAEQAAGQGQKEILDASVIGGLVRTMDTDSAVDGYVGDLLLGLDRLGRILFMYYWHNDKFKERYGQQDMIELEDNLRNVFKNLGELSLFLKQKTIEPDQANSSEVELSDVLG
jgi:hypothetical protein